jgi:O-antigen/teichoic acid export membrane protein
VSRLARNVLYNLSGQGLVLLLSFLAVRFIFRRLGSDAFGIIQFSIVVTTVLTSALDLGISSTTVREVSRHSETEPKYITELIRTASLLYWASGAVLLLVIFLTAPLLVTTWINLKGTNPATATTIIRILGVTAVVVLPRVLYASLIRGKQRMVLTNGIDVGTAALQQAGTLTLLLLGAGVFVVATWISTAAVLGTIAYLVTAARLFGWRALVPGFSRDAVEKNLGFTGQMTAISVLSLVFSQADKIVVSKLLPVAEFGYYGFAATTVSRATFVTGAISQAAFPSFSSLFQAGDRGGLLLQYRKLQDLVSFGTLPVFTAICFAALPVYGYIFNEPIARVLLLPTAFLAFGSYMNATLNIPYMVSLSVGHPEIATKLNLFALVAVLPVTVVLIYMFGLPGAGFSWVFYNLFAFAYAVPRICHVCLQEEPWPWYGQVLKVLGLGALTYGAVWLVLLLTGALTLIPLVVGYVVGSGLYLLGAYAMLGAELKETLTRVPQMLAARRAEVLPGP